MQAAMYRKGAHPSRIRYVPQQAADLPTPMRGVRRIDRSARWKKFNLKLVRTLGVDAARGHFALAIAA
jgi:hypothetical protein